jgi:hypothetical protein
MLEQILNDLAIKISKKRGFRTPYELIIKPELPPDHKGRDRYVIIQAGTPPIIAISRLYIEACVANSKSGILPDLRDTIERSLEILPKMYHTLSLVPIAQAITLRQDSKRWMKTLVPEYKTVLDDRYFSIAYAVTVTDNISGTSITRNGSDLEKITKEAKHDLSRMILQSEEMEEYRELMKLNEDIKKESPKPNSVSMTLVGQGQNETNLEY